MSFLLGLITQAVQDKLKKALGQYIDIIQAPLTYQVIYQSLNVNTIQMVLLELVIITASLILIRVKFWHQYSCISVIIQSYYQIIPPLNLIGYFSISYSHFLVKNLAFLIFFYFKAVKAKLANRRVLLVCRLTIPKFIGLLRWSKQGL